MSGLFGAGRGPGAAPGASRRSGGLGRACCPRPPKAVRTKRERRPGCPERPSRTAASAALQLQMCVVVLHVVGQSAFTLHGPPAAAATQALAVQMLVTQ